MSARAKTVKRVCTITGTRAEYGLLKPVMNEIRLSGLELRLIVVGMHLSPEFGNTVTEIEQDAFNIDARIDMGLCRDNNVAMTKSIGIGIYGMAQALESIDPDTILVLGDRVEAFAAAVSGAGLNKVVAHIHGGERSKGGLDESMRHAITKFAHLHFVATEGSRERVIRMGERPETVYVVGAPGLDSMLGTKLYDHKELEYQLGFRLERTFLLVVQHPVSTDSDNAPSQMRETLEAAKEVGNQTILVYPNSDAGGRRMVEVIESYRSQPWLHIFPSLDHFAYLSLLKHASVLVGNSSSGMIEASSFHIPVVNIGIRQAGRERSTNVIDVNHDRTEIKQAIQRALTDQNFRAQVQSCVNPYGEGKASKRIVEVLGRLDITPDLLQKQITY